MITSRWLGVVVLLWCVGTSHAASDTMSEQLTSLKSQALSAQRDLGLLERELTYSRDQLLMYLSVDIDTRFELVEAKLKVNGRTIKQHQFTPTEFNALRKGGSQPLISTQMVNGSYQVEVEVTAKDQNNTTFKQKETLDLIKSNSAKILSVHLLDNLNAQQYRFGINEWND